MTAYVALLRGINVGGHRKIAMPELCELLAALGLAQPRSLLQTGNLLFRDEGRSAVELEHRLEVEAAKRLGLETDVFVRSASEWTEIIAGNPFPGEAERDAAHLVLLLLKEAPHTARFDALRAAITGPETVAAGGRHAYAVYPNGIGRSRLTAALIERKLGTSATGRNWNTVLKLGALVT
jgi:uncharacterized protein (DUF1697 family)